MKKADFSAMTDAELLAEKRKIRKSRMMHALAIGFMAGILIFGFVSWSLSSEKRIGFLIPMLIPISIIYKLLKNPNPNKQLAKVLKERSLK